MADIHSSWFLRLASLALLLFCYLPEVAAKKHSTDWIHSPNDTIIIGGKRLIVEREVRYDTVSQETLTPPDQNPTQKPLKKRKKGEWNAFFSVLPGVDFHQLKSKTGNQATVLQFNGSAMESTFSNSFEAGMRFKPAKQTFWFSGGVSLTYASIAHQDFDQSQLTDSLFDFMSSPQSELQAIDRFRFPIGIEYDTSLVDTRNAPFIGTWIALPVGFGIDRMASAKRTWCFGFGFTARMLIQSKSETLMLLPDEGAMFRTVLLGDNGVFSNFHLSGWGEVATRFQLDSFWHLSTGIRFDVPLAVIDDALPVNYRAIRLSAVVGISYRFRK
jgi:hypothetical protein